MPPFRAFGKCVSSLHRLSCSGYKAQILSTAKYYPASSRREIVTESEDTKDGQFRARCPACYTWCTMSVQKSPETSSSSGSSTL